MQSRPNAKKNILEFWQELITEFNEGKITDIEYPTAVRETILKSSGGLIKPEELSLEKLNLSKSLAENILKQDYRFAQYFKK